jgi:hypothetical protein
MFEIEIKELEEFKCELEIRKNENSSRFVVICRII